ncbi:MAG: formyltransferase family protein [Clostridia bacterium]
MIFDKIYLLGMPDAVKTKLIINFLSKKKIWGDRNFEFITLKTDSYGCAVQEAERLNLNVTRIDKDLMYDDLKYLKKEDENILLIAIGWSYLIEERVLSLFNSCINCHGSLLPCYKGNNTYMHCYACLEEEYGMTIHYMNRNFDEGNIVCRSNIKFFDEETPLIMHRRICEITAMCLPESIYLVEQGYKGVVQKGISRYFYKISRDEMNELHKLNKENLKLGKEIIIPRFSEKIL